MGVLGTTGRLLGGLAKAPASGSVSGEVGGAATASPLVSAAGAVADIGVDAASGAMTAGKTLGGGIATGYLGHAAFGAGQAVGERLAGTRTDATVDAENQDQLHNGTWQSNTWNNVFANPGKGLDRLQTETRGAISDGMQAREDAQKTQQMETKRRMSRPMSEGYKKNVNQLQGLMSRSTQ